LSNLQGASSSFLPRLPRNGSANLRKAQLRGHSAPSAPCVSTGSYVKEQLVSAPARSSSNALPGLQSFSAAKNTQPAQAAAKAMSASSNDPFGAERFERSRARTPYGYKRLFDKVSRELIGIPLTSKQRREIRAQRPKLAASEIDKNAYRYPVVRERAPRDMPKRRAQGLGGLQFHST
jgi:hypothetical protein